MSKQELEVQSSLRDNYSNYTLRKTYFSIDRSQSSSRNNSSIKSQQCPWSQFIKKTSKDGFSDRGRKQKRPKSIINQSTERIPQPSRKNLSQIGFETYFQVLNPSVSCDKLTNQNKSNRYQNLINMNEQYLQNKQIRRNLRNRNQISRGETFNKIEEIPIDSVYRCEYDKAQKQDKLKSWKKAKFGLALPKSTIYKQFLDYKSQYDSAFQNSKYY